MRCLLSTAAVALCLLSTAAAAADLDLLARYPFTDPARSGKVEADSPTGRALLGQGWVHEGGEAVMAARRASLHLPLAAAGEAELELDCSGPAVGAARRVAVLVNGRRIAIVSLGPQQQRLKLSVRASATRRGDNRITLRTSERAPAGDAAGVASDAAGVAGDTASAAGDGQAVRCRSFSLRSASAELPPRAVLEKREGGGRRLVLPAGSSVRFFVPLEPGGSLRLDVCEGELALRLRGEDGGSEARLLAAGTPQVVPLRGLRGGFGLIEWLAVSDQAAVCGAVVVAEGTQEASPQESAGVAASGQASRRGSVQVSGQEDARRSRSTARHLVLVVIDTLRADRLGAYGNTDGLTPAMDRLAAEGVVFEQVSAQSAWTTPAVASILSGLDPVRHGARKLGAPIFAEAPLLAEELQSAGFRTAAVITNVNARAELGFARGFDRWTDLPEEATRPGRYAPGSEVVDLGLAELSAAEDERSFLYLHLSEPHAPYAPAAAHAKRHRAGETPPALAGADDALAVLIRDPAQRTEANLEWVRGQYDAEVATADAAIARLVDGLRERGLLDETLLVVLSDHGEAFGEHGEVGHGRSLFAEELRVPWILHGPGIGAPRREPALAQQVDVLPTLLDALGEPIPAGLDGVSVLGGRPVRRSPAFAETRLHRPEQAGFVVGDRKVIRRRGRSLGTRFEVYDLAADPLEERDVAAEHPFLVGWARQELRRREAAVVESEPSAIDESVRTRLQLLGYLGEASP